MEKMINKMMKRYQMFAWLGINSCTCRLLVCANGCSCQ